MALVKSNPKLMGHWTTNLRSILQPNDAHFYDIFAYIIMAGFGNLLLVLYTSRDIKLENELTVTPSQPAENERNDILLHEVQTATEDLRRKSI